MPIIDPKIFDNPALVESAYRQGHILGAITPDNPNERIAKMAKYEIDKLIQDDPNYRFGDKADSDIYGDYEGKLCLGWHAAKHIDVLTGKERQKQGDCVSMGKRTAIDQTRCNEIAAGEPESYKHRGATALVYSTRQWSGEGMNSLSAARGVIKNGLLLELPYESDDGDKLDFSDYEKYWTIGRDYHHDRMPAWLKEQTKPFGPKSMGIIRTDEELLRALWNGYGVTGGSMLGIDKRGGHQGVKWLQRPKGQWPHEMGILGFDARRKYSKDIIVMGDQSWGIWSYVKSTDFPEEYQPVTEGMWTLTLSDFMRYAVRPGSFQAFSNTNGFKAQRLPDFGVPENLFGTSA